MKLPSRLCLKCPHRLSDLNLHIKTANNSQAGQANHIKGTESNIVVDTEIVSSKELPVNVQDDATILSKQHDSPAKSVRFNKITDIEEEITASPSSLNFNSESSLYSLRYQSLCSICRLPFINDTKEGKTNIRNQDSSNEDASSIISFDDGENAFFNLSVILCLECAEEVAAMEPSLETESFDVEFESEKVDSLSEIGEEGSLSSGVVERKGGVDGYLAVSEEV